MLQNRYGDTRFPVRDSTAGARLWRRAVLRVHPQRLMLRNLAALTPAIVLLAVVFIASDGFAVPGGTGAVLSLAGLAGFALLVAAALVVLRLVDMRRPRLDQQRYRAMSGQRDVTPHQQQLLALDAQSDFSFGGWNSSLDYAPAWSQLPADAQRRHAQDARWQPFPSMPPLETDRLRADLDANWHVASAADLELAAVDLHAERSLTARFAAVLAGPDGERMLARVASLTGADQWDLRASTEADATGAAPGLRAADAQRVVSLVRIGFLAGYVSEAEAWRMIERGAAPAGALFPSWDAYWVNVRIGLAFITDRLDAVQRFDAALAGLRASAWPAARVAFPTAPLPAWLPRGTTTSADTE